MRSDDDISGQWSRRRKRLRVAGQFVLSTLLLIGVVGLAHCFAQCGNGVVDSGEDCDDGGTCLGGANAGTHCTAESDCLGNGMCVSGTKDRSACASDADCPGGRCTHCVPQGGDGCAANCTAEQDVHLPLLPGQLGACSSGTNIGEACIRDADCHGGIAGVPSGGCNSLGLTRIGSGLVIDSDSQPFPFPLDGMCDGGANAKEACNSDADCRGGTCRQSQEVLTLGKQKEGQIPLVVKVASVRFPPIPVSTLQCGCVRGVAAKTCGGTLFEVDGVTPTTDCSPRFTAGDSVCSSAGKPPWAPRL